MYIARIEIVHNCIVFIRNAVLSLNVRNKYYIEIVIVVVNIQFAFTDNTVSLYTAMTMTMTMCLHD